VLSGRCADELEAVAKAVDDVVDVEAIALPAAAERVPVDPGR